jgi:DNA-binding LacI/PurR family transcriptional regulator
VLLDLEFESSFRLDGYAEAVVEGVYEFCSAHGIEFSIFGEPTPILERMDLTKELYLRNADGAVVVGASPDRAYFADLERNHFPFCCVFDGPRDMTVAADNQAAGQLALEHLLDLGHKKIAVARQMVGRAASANRFLGFSRAARDRGLLADAIAEILPPSPDANYDWGREILRAWMSAGRPYSAIFCLAANMALGILSEAAVAGVRIPHDLSVLVCDDLIACAESAPPLSVVDIPNREAGETAARLVWARISGNFAPDAGATLRSPLPVRSVIRRASTAPPAA